MKRALLLAQPLPGHKPSDSSLLLLPTGGVPLLLRQVRLLQALGAEAVEILCEPASEQALAAALSGRLAAGPGVILVPVSGDGPSREVRARVEASPDPVVVLSAYDLLERGAVRRMFEARPGPGEVVVAVVQSPDGLASAVGLLAADPGAGATLEALLVDWPIPNLPAAEAKGGVSRLPLARRELAGLVRDERSHEIAEHALWEGCRKPLDGFVSRNLNRHVSLFISRRIAHTAIDPNHISYFNLFLGLLGGVVGAMGGYWAFLGAAVLLKLNSILDGVDGELARMRVQASVLGEWLDTISDDLSNQAFFIGVSIGAWRMTGDATWLALGAATAIPMGLVTAYYYTWCIKNGRGDILAFQWTFQTETLTKEELSEATALHRVLGFFKTLFRKDSFVMMFLVAALLGVLPYAFYVVAPAAVATLVMLAGQHVKQKRFDAQNQAATR